MKVLFLPHYSEPLKVMWPLVCATRERGHEASVVNMVRMADDRARVAALLESYAEPAKWVDLPQNLVTAKADPNLRAATHREAIALIERERPDVLVVDNEHIEFLAYTIDAATRRGIPSLCYQWTIANSSVRHTLEMRERIPKFRKEAIEQGCRKPKVVTQPVEEVIGGVIEFPLPYFGGGNATKMAVIGDGTRRVYEELGVPREKIVVTGYPIYEELYRKGRPAACGMRHGKIGVRERLGLPTDRPLFLWCTNDQKTYYQYDHTYEVMLDSWKKIRDAILEAMPGCQLVMKLHPKEPAAEYRPVVEGQPRVSLVGDCDVWELIAECDWFLTRFSSTGVSAMCLDKVTFSCNWPKVPGGTLFEDTGGTLHSNTLEEFAAQLKLVTASEAARRDAAARRERFIKEYIDIRERPATERFVDAVEQLAVECGAVGAAR